MKEKIKGVVPMEERCPTTRKDRIINEQIKSNLGVVLMKEKIKGVV